MALGFTHSPTEMNIMNLPGVKALSVLTPYNLITTYMPIF
jgi:hypothetical protein